LHLGNARTFLVNWLMARQNGWRILLRIEDLDGPRVKAGTDRTLIDELIWLGIDWDEGPMYQSTRHAVYRAAAERLMAQGNAYACVCSRREAATAASAPHADDGASIYPGTCRGRFASLDDARHRTGREPSVRFRMPETPLRFNDTFAGTRDYRNPAAELGDFVILKSDGLAAYQLAVVLDDAAAGVTDVVRGDDLIDSTPRQMVLYHALGLSDHIPSYTHLPLVVGSDGRRLAKRHGDTRLSHYRAAGVSAGQVLDLLAAWSGIQAPRPVATAADLVGAFDLSRLSHEPVVLRDSPSWSLTSRVSAR
jgi:glutamyl-tRNA synthetase